MVIVIDLMNWISLLWILKIDSFNFKLSMETAKLLFFCFLVFSGSDIDEMELDNDSFELERESDDDDRLRFERFLDFFVSFIDDTFDFSTLVVDFRFGFLFCSSLVLGRFTSLET